MLKLDPDPDPQHLSWECLIWFKFFSLYVQFLGNFFMDPDFSGSHLDFGQSGSRIRKKSPNLIWIRTKGPGSETQILWHRLVPDFRFWSREPNGVTKCVYFMNRTHLSHWFTVQRRAEFFKLKIWITALKQNYLQNCFRQLIRSFYKFDFWKKIIATNLVTLPL